MTAVYQTDQCLSILQKLTLRPGISISDPATRDGRLWNSALKTISRSQGWSQLHWGTQVASEEMMDLFVTWDSHADLQHFMTNNYQHFLTAIESLLPPNDTDSRSIPSPYILQLHPGMPSLELGAVSSLYELTFDPHPHLELTTTFTTTLDIEMRLCAYIFQEASQAIDSEGGIFLGITGVWQDRYDQTPSSLSTTATQDPPTKNPTQPAATFLIMIEWASQDAEAAVLSWVRAPGPNGDPSRNSTLMGSSDPFRTVEKIFTERILDLASAYEKHQVLFENVSASNVEWLDKDEKWSTHVQRLMDEEEEERRKGEDEASLASTEESEGTLRDDYL